ncbi:3-oxoadipate enol-lactonase [Methyloferula stellata]|uniref:3-oxoadipate enol-lactonase n=1 Tax=Methyloferula stellata TaxID=876270 RepID=UPI000378310C|nr:3-oxoadipate enol-lactonase [Methyloferula stellata]
MAELSIGGEAFHVEIEGDEDAPVLMLSNAMGANLHMWDAQIPALLKHYRVLRYDARGHGNSVVSEGPYSIADLGRDALEILDTLGLEKVDFLGLSLGGMVGQWLLTHAPKRIGKAILSDTAAQIASPDLWNSRIQTVLQDGMGAVASSLIEHWFTKDFRDSHPDEVGEIEDMILRTPPEGYAATCAAIRDADLREAVRSIQAPVLVMVGRHDTVTPQGIAALLSSTIPKAKLVTLEAAHLSNIEDAEQFIEKALEFLLAEEPVIELELEEVSEAPAPKKPRKPRVKKAPDVEIVVAPEPVAVTTRTKKKAAAKKAPVKKAAAKKAVPKKAAVKKTAAKKAAPKKAVKKSAAKKTAVKKTVAKKGPIKKGAIKKAATKKAVKKTAVKKTAAKKSTVKKAVKKTLPSRKAGPAKVARKPIKKAVAKKSVAKKAKRR